MASASARLSTTRCAARARHPGLQEAYIRKLIDTVQDLPNVLYEVVNESSGATADSVQLPDGSSIPTPVGDSTDWLYWVIGVVKRYEQERGYATHPIGMTMQYPVAAQGRVNEPLLRSAAEWVSLGFDEGASPVRPAGGTPIHLPVTVQKSSSAALTTSRRAWGDAL